MGEPADIPPLEVSEQQKINSPTSASEKSSSILGLNLKISPSLVNLIEKKLSPELTPTKTMQKKNRKSKTDNKVTPSISTRLKASNFSANLLKIGLWEKKACHEGEVVAKMYFYKRKFVWEILELGMKKKMEIQWSDIIGIRATYSDEQPDILEVELNQTPQFFHEVNPQPRKHTNWEAASDFTARQATKCRRHYLEFTRGTLQKHYEKLLQIDPHLRLLSESPYPSHSSPYFTMDHETQRFPCEFSMRTPRFALPYNQPFRNLYPSQLPRICNPIARQHIGAFEGRSGQIPFLRSHMGAMAMNSPSSVIQFPPIKEHAPFDMNPRSCYSGSNLLIADAGATMNPMLNESTPLWHQGFQNLKTDNDIVEQQQQQQGPPSSAYATLAPNLSPRRVSAIYHAAGTENVPTNSNDFQFLEDILLDDRLTSPPADEQRLLEEVNSFKSLLNETTQLDSQPQNFNGGGLDSDVSNSLPALEDSMESDSRECINSFRWPDQYFL